MAFKINLNSASKNDIVENIIGIDDRAADSIIRYRERTGGFKDFDELHNISELDRETEKKIRNASTLEDNHLQHDN